MENNLERHRCDREDRDAEYDARGIFLCFTCHVCRPHKLKKYKLDVRQNPAYYADERIEEEMW